MDATGPFRLFMLAIFLLSLLTAGYYRVRAGARGEQVSRAGEGRWLFWSIRGSGLLLFLSAVAYLLWPEWFTWAEVPLPVAVRWVGGGLGLLAVVLTAWTLQALGDNLTDTVAVRENHTLITTGPYRWVRHPYYVAFLLLVCSVSLLAANWWLAVCGLTVFLLLLVRVPREERELEKRFGDQYRRYREKTNGVLPRLTAVGPLNSRDRKPPPSAG
jgi:protein-S-isoprenylcysteine O-methyltransferase Ste14